MSVLVGKQAPDFTVAAVLGNGEIVDGFTLSTAIKGKYGLVFFYPLDFTFVCPSELIALDHRIPEFKARNVEVVAVSIDSHFTHNAWRNTPVNNGGIGQVQYTMAADMKHEICKAYDVESEGGVAFRGAFLIDDKGIVRSQIVNDLRKVMQLGRHHSLFKQGRVQQSMDEHAAILRALLARDPEAAAQAMRTHFAQGLQAIG